MTAATAPFAGPLKPLPDTIKACRVHRFGPPEVISLEDVARPSPGPGEVLVRVAAAGVGPWDGWIRAGRSALPQPLPLTLGSDLAGTVAAVGPDVTAFRPGDVVFGVTNARFTGAYAEYAVAAAGMVARQPTNLADVDAAAVPVVAVTAWQALFDQAGLKPKQTALIHGAAGNVGAFAVQLARRAGIKVVATVRGKDAGFVRCLGADRVVNVDHERFEDAAQGVDAVIDLVGGETQQRSFAVLKPGGRLISAVSEPDPAQAARGSIDARFFLVEVTTAGLDRIAALIADGRLQVQVGAVLPLAGARTAHEMLEGARPHPRGKIVLRVRA
ncbi:NADP-dependent oxidoreductase [Chelatococcus reniformis]|uniref:Quinone oxidoreductase n=1 Tax=Chelatococcus reniformis TaxID=1494448 RepID=A0A916U5A3_9HYPH|nr:NADP-dependent oxidoreductase [Chelatococcus reniformis]GGC61146.1 quinone oxidoreductase [Chelatococcus reniformis]